MKVRIYNRSTTTNDSGYVKTVGQVKLGGVVYKATHSTGDREIQIHGIPLEVAGQVLPRPDDFRDNTWSMVGVELFEDRRGWVVLEETRPNWTDRYAHLASKTA